MSLTVGTGPFGHVPKGTFNVETTDPRGVIYFEDSPRWICVPERPVTGWSR